MTQVGNQFSVDLRQTIRDINPRRFRSHVNMPVRFGPRIRVESSKSQAYGFRLVSVSLKNRRTASPAKTPPPSGRRLPLFQQLGAGNKSKRSRRHGGIAGKRRARRFAALAAVAVGDGP